MGKQIQITHVGERFSSHTQMRSCTRDRRTSSDTQALREQLIAAMVEVVVESGDPRLVRSRALT